MCRAEQFQCGASKCGPGNEAGRLSNNFTPGIMSGFALDFDTPLYLPLSITCSTLTCSRVKAGKKKKKNFVQFIIPSLSSISHSPSRPLTTAALLFISHLHHFPALHSSAHRPPHPHLVILHFCCRVLAAAPSSRHSC